MSKHHDLERGLRGTISGILIFEAITILLGIRVVQQLGGGGEVLSTVGVVSIIVLAVGHIGACAIVKRPFLLPVIAVLQLLLIACWVFHSALGVIGILFTLVWIAVFAVRREFRRRVAAGTLPPGW